MKFIWQCPECKTQNEDLYSCKECGFAVNLKEQPCIHSNGFDMACDECGRTGFRFPGCWNDGETLTVEESRQIQSMFIEPEVSGRRLNGRPGLSL